VEKAIVELAYQKELLRSEHINITLKTTKKVSNKLIKSKIREEYGTLTIPFKIIYIDNINYTSMGKKVIFDREAYE
jgi:hypothetical protein